MNTDIFTANYIFVLIMAGVMILTGYAHTFNVLGWLQRSLSKVIKNNKVLLVILSAIGGVLPIEGRTIATAGLLDAIIGRRTDLRPKFGILNYLATHHYYLWSPLEKTVIIPMAILNVSYFSLLGYTWPLLAISLAMVIGYVIFGLKDINNNDIIFSNDTVKKDIPRNPFKFVNWKSLFAVYAAIVAGNFAKENSTLIVDWVQSHSGSFTLISFTAFIAAWLMGSSSKFVGLVSVLCGIFGIQYFVYFFALEYAGYLLSPMHKCNAISCGYFKTPIKNYIKVLLIWTGAVILYGVSTLLGV